MSLNCPKFLTKSEARCSYRVVLKKNVLTYLNSLDIYHKDDTSNLVKIQTDRPTHHGTSQRTNGANRRTGGRTDRQALLLGCEDASKNSFQSEIVASRFASGAGT